MSATPTPDPTSPEWSIYLASQPFNLTSLDGTPITLQLSDIDLWLYYNTSEVISYAFALGFASMLFIILLILSRAEQRRQPVFILNLASLFFIMFRGVIGCIALCASYRGIASTILGARAQYSPATWAPYAMSMIINILIYGTIISSLVLQVRVVFAAEPSTQRFITWVMTFLGVVFMGIAVAFNVFSLINTFKPRPFLRWLYNLKEIYFICFIGISSCLFLYKLMVTILRRRRMHLELKKFGPLQIILIMFLQSLLLPLIIYIIDFTITFTTNFNTLAEVFLVVCLPLSSLWASSDATKLRPPPSKIESISSGGDSLPSKRSKFGNFRKSRKPAESNESTNEPYSELEKGSFTDSHTTAVPSAV